MAAPMPTFAVSLLFATLSLFFPSAPAQQAPRPSSDNPAAVGAVLFRMRCADCHGIDAKGVLGPDLTTLWADGRSDDRVFRTIREGVAGTEMPASTAPDAELQAIVAYLRTLNVDSSSLAPVGRASNNENGERVFMARCAGCHLVDGRGGRLGPDLSRVGLRRSRAMLAKKIRTPGLAGIPGGYQAVTLITRDGARVRGTRKNEDAFSIQIMDIREQLVSYQKSSLKEVIADAQSLMPSFSPDRLSDADLEDLIGYLSALRRPVLGR
jgi:cytochrome c oxidase cbb3-type subunit 3